MIHKYIDCAVKMFEFCEEHAFQHTGFYYLRDLIMCMGPEKAITLTKIKRVISAYFFLKPGEMESRNRHERIRLPRQFAHYYAIRLTELSLDAIGSRTGQLGHATVINSRKKIEQLIETKHPTKHYVAYLDLEILFAKQIEEKRQKINETMQPS